MLKNQAEYGQVPKNLWSMVRKSALEWLAAEREFPIIMLQCSYRCQNPRLLRFASTLFYDAGVKASTRAEYYQLPLQRTPEQIFSGSLKLLRTSELPGEMRHESLIIEGCKPGLENRLEAALCCRTVYEAIARYPLHEITVISPYRRQVALIRNLLSRERAMQITGGNISEKQVGNLSLYPHCHRRQFSGRRKRHRHYQLRAQPERRGHRLCRRCQPHQCGPIPAAAAKWWVISDLESLKANAKNNIFVRMERAFQRDGQIINVTPEEADTLLSELPELDNEPETETECRLTQLAPPASNYVFCFFRPQKKCQNHVFPVFLICKAHKKHYIARDCQSHTNGQSNQDAY